MIFLLALLILNAEAAVIKSNNTKIVVTQAPQIPTSIANMQPGQWFKAPNTKLRSVAATGAQGNVIAVMGAWSGGAYDTKRNRLIIWGGGHSDYSGNEVYVFDVPTLKWVRLSNPSSAPLSVHTYNHLQYLPKQDALIGFGGSTWQQGNTTETTWMFNFSNNQWTQKSGMPGSPYSFYYFNMTSGYDPLTDLVLVAAYQMSGSFSPTTNVWKTYGSTTHDLYETGTFNTKNRKFYKFGGGKHSTIDVSNTGVMANEVNLTTSGDKTIEDCTNPGVEYDALADRIVGWCDASDVFSFNANNNTWTKHIAKSGSGPIPAPWYLPEKYTGTFGRWRYIPEYNVYVVVTHVDDDVYFYKLSNASGQIP